MTTDAQSLVARDLFLYYLRDTFGRGFRPAGSLFSDGEKTLSIEARPLVASGDAAWEERRAFLESVIAEDLPVRVALWIPVGARLPHGEPATSEFISLVRQQATRLGPHERSYVAFPITLLLRKSQETGGVVSVTGGLNPYWARLTDRVRGQYDLDATALHRLPESADFLDRLLEAVVEASQRLDVGDVARIETVDAWTVQRLSGDSGATLVGVPPAEASDLGMTVRRNFRRTILDAAPRLRDSKSDLRALVVWGPYARIDQEGATTALRGYDPSSYAGLDFVCLVADGVVKPLIQPQVSFLVKET